MNPSSIRFVFEALLLGVHMQVTLEVLQKDVKSDEHLDEVVWVFRKCQRLQWHLDEVVLFFFPQMSAVAMLSGGRRCHHRCLYFSTCDRLNACDHFSIDVHARCFNEARSERDGTDRR